jgi:surfactin synthase thioesterase subunit
MLEESWMQDERGANPELLGALVAHAARPTTWHATLEALRARRHGLASPLGALGFLVSALLTRGVGRFSEERDDPSQPLLDPQFGHCSQEVLNLLLLGVGVSNVFDGSRDLGGGFMLRGVPLRPPVGLLSELEALRYLQVGSFFKQPVHPIWVVASESHYSILFALTTRVQAVGARAALEERLLAAFSELARAAPEWMEVIGVEMPGKGARADMAWPGEAPKFGEAPNFEAAEAGASTDPLVGDRAEAAMMERLADRLATDSAGTALVLVGWSMGGMLAAELALALTARGCPPQMLHVAGRMAPGSFLAAGDDVDKYLLASDEMKATDAWKEWLLPTLLADLRADARAEQRARALWVAKSAASGAPPLQCMLQVCAGTEDAAFPPSTVQAWRPFTSGAFESHLLSGGHDVLQRCTVELLRLIVAALLPATPLYSVKWVPTAGNAGSAQALPPLATKGPLTWRTLGSELDPEIAPQIGSEIAAHADEMQSPAMAAESTVLSAALGSPLGLLLYVGAVVDVGAQQRQVGAVDFGGCDGSSVRCGQRCGVGGWMGVRVHGFSKI